MVISGYYIMATQSILGLLCLLAVAFSTPLPKKLSLDDVAARLPIDVVPTAYTLQFTFPEAAFTKENNEFQGTATINFRVDADITEIKLHLSYAFLSISELTVNDKDLTAEDYSVDQTTDILTIKIDDSGIKKGNSYIMIITYTGKISDTDNYGIYRSSYTNSDKETVYLIATQFEPTYARRAFPCFDEPSFKATYEVSVVYPSTKNLGVLFNTDKTTGPTKDGDTNTIIFKTTPKMSSYLVALVISDFDSSPGVNIPGDTGVPYTVWSRSDTKDSRAYAVEVGPKILQKLNDYTGRVYSTDTEIAKVDQVALPDLTVGAMENWGLVTYREKYLLLNDEDSTNSKQTVATIIAHELAHQWFGNLITCDWWSVAFLNEGPATYFEYFIPHEITPEWELDKQFVVDVLQQVLESDAQQDSQALQSDVASSLEISDKFGSVSYKKGGSMFRMLTHIMGQDNFKAGIQEYFKSTELLHGTSTPSQLWDILQKQAKKEATALPDEVTITTVMQNWVERPGYPLLTVTLNGKELKISQERFLLAGQDKDTKWYVPITYVESSSETKFQVTNPTTWLTLEKPEITVSLENDNDWVMLNPLQTGYFRINYDANLRTKIAEALKKENFDGIIDLNRANFVDDLFNLAAAEKLAYSKVLKAIDFLQQDDSYYSWVSAITGFGYMLQRIPEGLELRTFVQDQLLNLMDTLYKSVSFTEVKDDQIYTLKQVLAFSWACSLGKEDCVTKAKEAFSAYKKDQTKFNKNLKSVVYCSALKNSDDATDYDFLWNLYTESGDSIEQVTILKSLGCSNSEAKLTELLTEAIKADSKIRIQDSLNAFASVYEGSQKGAGVALDFLVANLPGILTKYSSTSARRSLITGIAGKLTTDVQVQKFKTLTESSKDFPDDLKEDAEKAATQAETNVKWITNHKADLKWFYVKRLPTDVVPTSYNLKFTFPDAAFTKEGTNFEGSATINFEVEADIAEIKLHQASSISITTLKVNGQATDYTPDSATETLTIPTASLSLEAGKHSMEITYQGTISTTDSYGIYKSSYINSAKETVYLIATQFEPTYARRAFPCFDEPSFKATYDVSVDYPSTKNLGVLFNTDKKDDPTKDGNTYTVTFKTTPKMSSYLVALVISDFDSTQGVNIPGDTDVSYTVWSRTDTKDSRTYAVEVGPKILQKLNEYTGRAYSTDKEIAKVDQVALPDLGAGAMENWGLVTYREQALLLNAKDSTNSKKTVATIIAHELAHQWFGNLITCDWWSEAFLNEGPATYFEYFIPHEITPEWELDKQFVVDVLQQVLTSDAQQDSQALQSDVSSSLQISDKFGSVSYKKGGSMFRMLTYIMGQDNFKAGIQEYFQSAELLHGTSNPSKLWDILQKHAKKEVTALPDGVTITTVMQNWVEKPGYPLLTVTLNEKELKISQERFLLAGEDKDTKWYVPITYVESSNVTKFQDTNPTTWLTLAKPDTSVTLKNDNDWVLLNPLQTGYFRVNYDAKLRAKIAAALKKDNFDGIVDLNRAHFVDDLFNLAAANRLAYSEVLTIIDFLKKEDSYYTWVSAFTGVNYMLQRIPEGSELRTNIQDHLLTLIDALYKSMSFTDEKDDDQIYTSTQVLVLSWACNLGNQDCVTKAKDAFTLYKTDQTKINKNLKSVIFRSDLKNSDDADATDYDFLWQLYTASGDSIEQATILNSLGCSKNEDKLKDLLKEAIKADSKIRTQDSLTAFASVYEGSQKGAGVALDFLVANLPGILAKYPSTRARRSLITGIAGKLTTTAQIEKLKTLIESDTAGFPADLKEDVEKAVTQAETNVKWIDDHKADLEAFFKGDTPDDPGDNGGGASAVHINVAVLLVVGVFSLLKLLSF